MHFYKHDVSYAIQYILVFKSDLKWPFKKMTRLYIQKLRGNEIKNLTILYSNEYKRQQLIKHQLFTAEVKMITIKLLLTMSLPPDITLNGITLKS